MSYDAPMVEFNLEIPVDMPADGKKILDQWTDHAQELADELKRRIQARTPRLTGALQSGVMGIGGIDHGYPKRTLLECFFDPAPQIETWKRQYDVYQEGPPLGLSTYTNPPRHMLNQAEPTDVPTIESWAYHYAQEGADEMAADAMASGFQIVEVI